MCQLLMAYSAAMSELMSKWNPASWQTRPVSQQPAYADAEHVDQVLERLGALPPLVTSWEVEALREYIASAQAGNAFVLQGQQRNRIRGDYLYL